VARADSAHGTNPAPRHVRLPHRDHRQRRRATSDLKALEAEFDDTSYAYADQSQYARLFEKQLREVTGRAPCRRLVYGDGQT